jgi:iron complex outermembrane recepter protein
MRGLGSEPGRSLILMDGVPINKGETGEVNWNRIDIDEVQRLEIFKGPGSSVYGNNAMGGVINIISRKPVNPIIPSMMC